MLYYTKSINYILIHCYSVKMELILTKYYVVNSLQLVGFKPTVSYPVWNRIWFWGYFCRGILVNNWRTFTSTTWWTCWKRYFVLIYDINSIGGVVTGTQERIFVKGSKGIILVWMLWWDRAWGMFDAVSVIYITFIKKSIHFVLAMIINTCIFQIRYDTENVRTFVNRI